MRLEFLSDGWFAKVKELGAAVGALNTPAYPVINVTVRRGPGDEKQMALVGGLLERGHRAEAGTTVILNVDLARRVFIDGDQLAGMQGFMSGQIRVEGDQRGLKALQSAEPTASEISMRQKIKEVTA